MKGWMYILECADGSYYTGSTNNLELRLAQHQTGNGANHTKSRLPVKLVYWEEYERIDQAFYREKQVQGWNRKKKEALILGKPELLPELARNYAQFPRTLPSATSTGSVASSGSGTAAEPACREQSRTVEAAETAGEAAKASFKPSQRAKTKKQV